MKRIKTILITIVIIAALIGLDSLWVTYRYIKPFRRIGRGHTEADVLKSFGKPQYISNMRDKVTETYERGDSFTTAGTEIVKDYCYWPPLGFGGHFCFGFDADGHVVARGQPPKL